jgi:hypothetical protein
MQVTKNENGSYNIKDICEQDFVDILSSLALTASDSLRYKEKFTKLFKSIAMESGMDCATLSDFINREIYASKSKK